MIHPRFAAALGLGILLWVSLFLGFTLLVDPYGVSPLHVSVAGFNKYKPRRVDIDRLLKPYEVWRYQPRTVFLGTSRTHQSMDPAVLDGTRFAPAYNASVPASSLGLNVSHLQEYLALDPQLRTVVVELFLYNFLGQKQERAAVGMEGFVRNSLTLFASADTLWSAVQTLGYNVLRKRPAFEIAPGGYYAYPPGQATQGSFDGFAAGIWKLHATRTKGLKLYEPAFVSLQALVDLCRRRNVELIFVLSPNHAYDDYYIDAVGAWGRVEEWLERVSSLGVPVYSFSQPNAWVYEPVSDRMRYWYDPYHFTLRMGRAILHSLAGVPDAGPPGDFAVRLSPDNVTALLEKRRTAIREWAGNHPAFVAAFQKERRLADPVTTALGDLATLQRQLGLLFPAASIHEYRNVTGEILAGIPANIVAHGRIENVWGGRLVAQVFPPNAWGNGVPATYNYFFEAVPRKDCVRLVEALGRESGRAILRINVEPSGTVHSRFPVTGDSGCREGANTVGFTELAG